MKDHEMLADLLCKQEIVIGQDTYKEYRTWLAQLSHPKLHKYLLDVNKFMIQMSIPERSKTLTLADQTSYNEAIVLYALALWRLYERRSEV